MWCLVRTIYSFTNTNARHFPRIVKHTNEHCVFLKKNNLSILIKNVFIQICRMGDESLRPRHWRTIAAHCGLSDQPPPQAAAAAAAAVSAAAAFGAAAGTAGPGGGGTSPSPDKDGRAVSCKMRQHAVKLIVALPCVCSTFYWSMRKELRKKSNCCIATMTSDLGLLMICFVTNTLL